MAGVRAVVSRSLAFSCKNRQMEPMLVALEEQETEPALRYALRARTFNLVREGNGERHLVGKNSLYPQ